MTFLFVYIIILFYVEWSTLQFFLDIIVNMSESQFLKSMGPLRGPCTDR